MSAETFQNVTGLVVRFGECWVEGLGSNESSESFRVPAKPVQGQAVVKAIRCHIGPDCDRLSEPRLGLIDGTLLKINLAEEMESVWVGDVSAEDVFIEDRGLGQSGGAMVLHCLP